VVSRKGGISDHPTKSQRNVNNMHKETIVYKCPKGMYLAYWGYTPSMDMEEFEQLSEEEKSEWAYDISWDSYTAPRQGSDMPMYLVLETELEDWITKEEYIKFYVDYLYFTGYYWETLKKKTLDTHEIRGLWMLHLSDEISALSEKRLSNILKTKNPRSDFKISLIQQIKEWLATPKAMRKYKSPLSYRQLEASDYGGYIKMDHDQQRSRGQTGMHYDYMVKLGAKEYFELFDPSDNDLEACLLKVCNECGEEYDEETCPYCGGSLPNDVYEYCNGGPL